MLSDGIIPALLTNDGLRNEPSGILDIRPLLVFAAAFSQGVEYVRKIETRHFGGLGGSGGQQPIPEGHFVISFVLHGSHSGFPTTLRVSRRLMMATLGFVGPMGRAVPPRFPFGVYEPACLRQLACFRRLRTVLVAGVFGHLGLGRSMAGGSLIPVVFSNKKYFRSAGCTTNLLRRRFLETLRDADSFRLGRLQDSVFGYRNVSCIRGCSKIILKDPSGPVSKH